MKKNIFTYVNKEDNIMFSKLEKKDLQKILDYIGEYYLEYRNILGVNNNDTFGVEIENDSISKNDMNKKISQYDELKEWQAKYDPSIENGCEVISNVLYDTDSDWKKLYLMCQKMKDGKIDDNCGAHVHVGAQIIDNEKTLLKFIRLWARYEKVFFRFTNGEFIRPRASIIKHATPVADTFKKYFKSNKTGYFILERESLDRCKAVNLSNVYKINKYDFHNTIEFRTPNGTLNPIIWQNNINTFIKLLEYCKKVDELPFSDCKLTRYELYNKIYLEDALELCDTIFDNNLDKVYFLKQYLKNFENSNEVKSVKLTRYLY